MTYKIFSRKLSKHNQISKGDITGNAGKFREHRKTSRKRPLTLEYNLFSMPELISECWKTRVFLNLLEFTVTENQRKRKKTACKSRNNAQFS